MSAPWKAIRFSGKWMIYAGRDIKNNYCSVINYDVVVAEIDPYDDMKSAEARKYAHLIAAAPELLKALQRIILAVDACGKDDDKSLIYEFTEQMELQARAAIAKALNQPITE